MLYVIQVNAYFPTKAAALSAMRAVKSAVAEASTVALANGQSARSSVALHRCTHDTYPPSPCETLETVVSPLPPTAP